MSSSVRFTEEMLGHVTFGELDFARGARQDRDGSTPFKFHLTIEVADIAAFGNDPLRPATAAGWIESDAFGGKLPVEQGWFNLFVDVEPGVKHMLYRLWFSDGVGHPLTMTGFKLVSNDAGFDVWKDTTTLFTRVLQGHVPEGSDEGATVIASGIIVIRARDFAKQLTTFRGQVGAMAKFGLIFTEQLAEAYLRKGRKQHGVHA
jgi:cholesterol oxidase